MPNYLVVEIAIEDAISDMNSKANMSTKQFESVQGVINYLSACKAGCKPASVKIVSKDAATTINTSGTGSASNTFSF